MKEKEKETLEDFLALPREERIERVLNHIGYEHNKCQEDIMTICGTDYNNQESFEDFCPNIKSIEELELIIDVIREDLSERMTTIVKRFNELCDDVIIYGVEITEIDPEKNTCKVVPALKFIDKEEE